jgi:hypothetical protein
MLKLQSPYTPFVLQKIQVKQPQSTINFPTNALNPHGDTFVKARSGVKSIGSESDVKKALAALKKSHDSASAQKLKDTVEAWLVKLEASLTHVASCPYQKASVERSMATAREHLETALTFIQED